MLRIPLVRYGVGGGLAAAGTIIAPFVPPAGIPIAAVGAVVLAGGNIAGDVRIRASQIEEAVRAILRTLANTLRESGLVSPQCSIRSCIFSLDPSRQVLKSTNQLNDNYLDQARIVWRSDEGAVGYAWEQGVTQIYPDDQGPATNASLTSTSKPWGMTREQILKMLNVVCQVASPIPSPDSQGSLACV